MYLIFDTETTGIPHNKTAPLTDLDNWPGWCSSPGNCTTTRANYFPNIATSSNQTGSIFRSRPNKSMVSAPKGHKRKGKSCPK